MMDDTWENTSDVMYIVHCALNHFLSRIYLVHL